MKILLISISRYVCLEDSVGKTREFTEKDYDHRLYSCSFIAQLVKNPPTMRKTWVRSLGWEDPLEKGQATHSSILAWRFPWTV